MATKENKGYALVDYDVHADLKDKDAHLATYQLIYAHLGGIALRFTDSVYIVKQENANITNMAFAKINDELKKKKLAQVEFHVTEVSHEAYLKMRSRSVKSLNDQVREIAQSLLHRIERLEARFNEKTDDVEAHLYKSRLAVARARRELDEARGLATMFMIEKEAETALEASNKIIEAEALKRQAKKDAKKEAEKKAAESTPAQQ